MKIYYVRHGQTDLNLSQKMQGGGTEKELNETGISQAYNTKKELRHHGAMKKHTVCRSFLLKKGVVFHEINRPR